MTQDTCPRCQSSDLKVVRLNSGPHYAKLTCPDGHFIRWVAKPSEASADVPPSLLALIAPRTKPVVLQGTEKQVAAGKSIRAKMIAFANRSGADETYVRLLACITDASWFLANVDRQPPHLKCWPRPDQLAQGAE